jgi:hypothetical protein
MPASNESDERFGIFKLDLTDFLPDFTGQLAMKPESQREPN